MRGGAAAETVGGSAEPAAAAVASAVALEGAVVRLGARTIWSDVSLTVREGEFVAVLGPNGAGKSTLVKAVLGLVPLAAGRASVLGRRPGGARARIGYLPQRHGFDAATPVRGVDLVRLGLDGARWPRLLLLDEPLDSLDLQNQAAVAALVRRICVDENVAVMLVTHDVNPILGYLDRVVYVAAGTAIAGPPEEVVSSETLSRLYRAPVEVLRASDGRLVVVGHPEAPFVHGHRHDRA